MSRPSPHCVEQLQFEVDFDSAEHAFEEQNRVAAFARARAPAILDEVFEQFSPGGQVWRFAALEIDLGCVAHDELERQWEARLRERLAQVLQEQQALLDGLARAAAGGDPASPTPPQSREQAQLETLLYFLQHGHLPWNAPQGLASPIEQLAHEVLRDNAAALVSAWRASPAARTMVLRAARQFSPTWLAGLARALARSLGVGAAAAWGRDAQAWVQGFAALWGESRLLPSSPPAHLMWQGLLTALWTDAGVVDRSQPVHSMVQAMVPEPVEQIAVWRALQAVARRAIDGTPPAPTATLSDELLRACLAAPLPRLADSADADGEQATRSGSRADEQARLHLRLQAWFEPHAPGGDLAPWRDLLRAEPSWARQTVLLLGRSVAARRRMAQALSPAMLLALTALWLSPAEQSLLQAALPQDALWGAGIDLAQRWELTLSHVLLHPAPALFNASDYLDDMLQRRGERENRSVDSLLLELVPMWRKDRPRDPGSEPVHALMQAWLRQRLPAAPAESTPTALRRVRLESALSQGVLGGVEDDWFVALHDDATWLQDLLRRVGRRPTVLRRIARDWGSVPRLQLTALWLPAADRAAVIAAIHNPAFAVLAASGEDRPELFLWEDLLAHLLRLTPGTFFHADAYVRGLRERAAGAQTRARDDTVVDAAPDLIQQLLHSGPWLADDAAAFTRALVQFLDAPRPQQQRAWLQALESPQAAQRLVDGLTAAQLDRLLAWLRPAEHPAVQQNTLLMQAACRHIDNATNGETLTRLTWRFVLRELFEEGRRFDPAGFSFRLAQHLVTVLRPVNPPRWLGRLAAEVERQAPPGSASAVAAALAAAANATAAPTAAPTLEEALAPEPGDTIYIDNAGMVLAGAYLQRLVGMLGLADDEAFVSPGAAERAVHLLQYLVTGKSGAPEPLLVLNKLLCGLPIGAPVLREFTITPQESEAVDGLLQAMISHWKVIGHTSIAGLREAFLQREGRLTFDDEDGWHLQVEPRAFDMLLDQLPWGYSLHKLPWMQRPLHVEWR